MSRPAWLGTDGGGGTYPVSTGTLSEILTEAVPSAGTLANPSDIYGCTLQSTGSAWVGCIGYLTASQFSALPNITSNFGASGSGSGAFAWVGTPGNYVMEVWL